MMEEKGSWNKISHDDVTYTHIVLRKAEGRSRDRDHRHTYLEWIIRWKVNVH